MGKIWDALIFWDRGRKWDGPDADNHPPPYVEPQSADPDWILAKAYIRQRLVDQRRNLETMGLSHSDTEGIRYAIRELEGVLNFQKPSKMLDEG